MMVSKRCKSIAPFVRKRLSQAKSEEEVELLTNVLDRLSCFEKAEAGDVDELIKLSKQVLGTEND